IGLGRGFEITEKQPVMNAKHRLNDVEKRRGETIRRLQCDRAFMVQWGTMPCQACLGLDAIPTRSLVKFDSRDAKVRVGAEANSRFHGKRIIRGRIWAEMSAQTLVVFAPPGGQSNWLVREFLDLTYHELILVGEDATW